MELLRELVPTLRRVAVLLNPANPNVTADMEDITAAGHALGLELHILGASTESEIDGAFASLVSTTAEALFVIADAFLSGRDPLGVGALPASPFLCYIFGTKMWPRGTSFSL